ncbi:synaptotagmin-like protein 3 [Engraulis encrasicolus]|uniref:synaptotagmin-like protein 3 n=1 Tax=Engraulis encrasicolus TaxID=184585 RepID=UPI002FD2023F
MDLSLLQALEREKVLEVLQRDKILRCLDEERIRRLKQELQELRRRGAKSLARQYGERTCARCQRPLGKFYNCGAVCQGCSHRICTRCRVGVGLRQWKCTVCHAQREVKIKSGEWFIDERAKKFPRETVDKRESIGEILLRSYQRLSNIAIVPPTPPPVQSVVSPPFSRLPSSKGSPRPFTKSMENLMMSFTTHIKKMSKSQEDVREEPVLLTVDLHGRRFSSEDLKKSQSDTAINKSGKLTKVPSLPNLFKRRRSSSPLATDEESSQSSGYSGEKRGSSTSSTATECGGLLSGAVAVEGEGSSSAAVSGEVQLSLAYCCSSSCLEVGVGACRNLAYGDPKRNKCHPYVKVYLMPDKPQSTKMKTAVIKNTTEPIFQETLKCSIAPELLASRSLQASVWHAETLRRKVFLGEVLIPLDQWSFQDARTQGLTWYPLSPKTERPLRGGVEPVVGELLVKVRFSSLTQICKMNNNGMGPYEVGQLTVLITAVQKLSSPKPTSVFIKGCLILPGERELVQRTAVVKQAPGGRSAPQEWPLQLQLVFSRVTPHELHDALLMLGLWEHPALGLSDRLMGTATVNAGEGLSWKPLQQSPNVWHSLSLPLRANVNSRKP